MHELAHPLYYVFDPIPFEETLTKELQSIFRKLYALQSETASEEMRNAYKTELLGLIAFDCIPTPPVPNALQFTR